MENENTTDFDYNAEFNKYADSFSDNSSVDPNNTIDDTEDNPVVQEKPAESDTSSHNEPEVDDSDDKELPLNYQELYLKERQRAAATEDLLNSRMREISKQYQELKSKKDKDVFIAPEEDESLDKLPANVKELFETYPDIAAAMKEYVNHKFKSTLSRVETAVNTKVQPLENKIQYTEAQRHEAVIRSAHPDVMSIIDSGDLFVWMNSLDPINRAGAMHIYQQGTAEEIVTMLDTYKQARGVSKAKPKQKIDAAKTVEGTTPAYDSNTEDVVKKVIAAMNVPSGRAPIDIAQSKPPKQFDPDAEFNRLVSKWEKEKR